MTKEQSDELYRLHVAAVEVAQQFIVAENKRDEAFRAYSEFSDSLREPSKGRRGRPAGSRNKPASELLLEENSGPR